MLTTKSILLIDIDNKNVDGSKVEIYHKDDDNITQTNDLSITLLESSSGTTTTEFLWFTSTWISNE